MYWCDKCQIWEHEKCLVNAIRKQYLKENPPATSGKRPRQSKGKNIEITISARDESGGVAAHIGKNRRRPRVSGGPVTQEEDTVRVETESSQEQDTVNDVMPVRCLKCGNVLT